MDIGDLGLALMDREYQIRICISDTVVVDESSDTTIDVLDIDF
jgi:hypothetical protein